MTTKAQQVANTTSITGCPKKSLLLDMPFQARTKGCLIFLTNSGMARIRITWSIEAVNDIVSFGGHLVPLKDVSEPKIYIEGFYDYRHENGYYRIA